MWFLNWSKLTNKIVRCLKCTLWKFDTRKNCERIPPIDLHIVLGFLKMTCVRCLTTCYNKCSISISCNSCYCQVWVSLFFPALDSFVCPINILFLLKIEQENCFFCESLLYFPWTPNQLPILDEPHGTDPSLHPPFYFWSCTEMNYVHTTHFPLLSLNRTSGGKLVLIHLPILCLYCAWQGVGTQLKFIEWINQCFSTLSDSASS